MGQLKEKIFWEVNHATTQHLQLEPPSFVHMYFCIYVEKNAQTSLCTGFLSPLSSAIISIDSSGSFFNLAQLHHYNSQTSGQNLPSHRKQVQTCILSQTVASQ